MHTIKTLILCRLIVSDCNALRENGTSSPTLYNPFSFILAIKLCFVQKQGRSKQRRPKRHTQKKMTTIRRFCCEDLLRFTSVNLDHLTETVRDNLHLKNTQFHHWELDRISYVCAFFGICFSFVALFSVQYVFLSHILGEMARLLPCCWRSRRECHGLQ